MRHIPEDELHAYLDQGLSRSQCVEIESHLAGCSSCRANSRRDRRLARPDHGAPRHARAAPPVPARVRLAAPPGRPARAHPPPPAAGRGVGREPRGRGRTRLDGQHAGRARPTSVATRSVPTAGPALRRFPPADGSGGADGQPAPARRLRWHRRPAVPRGVHARARAGAAPAAARPPSGRGARTPSAPPSWRVLDPAPALELDAARAATGRARASSSTASWRTMSWDGAQSEAGESLPAHRRPAGAAGPGPGERSRQTAADGGGPAARLGSGHSDDRRPRRATSPSSSPAAPPHRRTAGCR